MQGPDPWTWGDLGFDPKGPGSLGGLRQGQELPDPVPTGALWRQLRMMGDR